MSNISSVSSTAYSVQTPNQNAFVQFFHDFNAIGKALQSGSLSTSQSALSTFQQDLPASTNQPFGDNSQANTDYLRLTSDVQTGNLSDAQKAFASLQNDLQGAGLAKTHKAHHHDFSSTTPPTTPADGTATTSAVDGGGENDGSVLNSTA